MEGLALTVSIDRIETFIFPAESNETRAINLLYQDTNIVQTMYVKRLTIYWQTISKKHES